MGDIGMHPAKQNYLAAALGLVFTCAVTSASSAGETYYRWVDENGTPVNSDHPPPPGVKYEEITTGSGLRYPSSAPDTPQTPVTTDSKGNNAESPAPQASQAPPKNPEACKAARQNLETLNSHARIRMPDGDGGYRVLNQEEIATQRELAEAAIARECE